MLDACSMVGSEQWPIRALRGHYAAARVHYACRRCGGCVAACSACAPGGKIHRIGMISPSAPLSTWREAPFLRAFLAGLHDLGYEEGRDIAIEFRSAEGN